MKSSFKLVRIPIVFIAIAAVIYGCSGGGNPTPIVPGEGLDPIRLTLQAPFGNITTGTEVTLPILVSDAVDLYAFSFRVEYEPLGAEPIEVDWADFRVENDIVFTPLNEPGLLPIAYSNLDGLGFNGDGTVCLLRFKVKDASKFHVRLVTEPEYLVGYDYAHARLNLTAGGEV